MTTKTAPELAQAKREIRKLRKYLRELTDTVGGCVLALDFIAGMPEGQERGKALARVVNELEIGKDLARHFGLGMPLKKTRM